MGKQKSKIRSTLGRIKNFTFSIDLQDIYHSDCVLSPSVKRPDTIEFKVYDNLQVLELIEDVNPMTEQERLFSKNRLQAGDKAIIGFIKGKAVFYGWVMLGKMEITFGVFVPVAKNTAFAYNLFTDAFFRRRGILTAFYHFMKDYLESQAIKSLYCGIAASNAASIKAHHKNGFNKSGYFYTLKILGICFTIADGTHSPRFSINRIAFFPVTEPL